MNNYSKINELFSSKQLDKSNFLNTINKNMFANQKLMEQNLNKVPATNFSPYINKNGRSMSVDYNKNGNNNNAYNAYQPQFPQTMPQFNQMMNPYNYH